jgi:hypothetical protein
MLFLAPWMLIGLVGLGVPIAIHLRDRSKSESLDWPTLRFLKVARQQSSRRSRIKHWLVLAARCLLLALLVLAMSKPYFSDSDWAKPTDLPTTVVVVLDNSYSMGFADTPDATRFDRAKQAAIEQLADLSVDDEVGLVLINEQAVVLTESPTRDHDRVRQLIREADMAPRGTNLAAGLGAAFTLAQLDAPASESVNADGQPDAPTQALPDTAGVVRERRAAWRQVVLLTDMQDTGWRSVFDTGMLTQQEEPVPLTVIDVSGPENRNRFVQQIEVREDSTGNTLSVDVQVIGAGNETATLWIDGQRVGAPARINPANSKATLTAPMPSQGVHAGMVTLEDDRLPIDDRGYFTVRVGGGRELVIVDGDPSNIPSLAETFYLNAALATTQAARKDLAITRLSPRELSSAALPKGGCIILANVKQLDGVALTKLENFLRAGGNLFITLGDNVDTASYNADWSFMPLKLDGMLGDPGKARAYSMLIEAGDHPLFAGRLDLGATRYFAFIGGDPTTMRDGSQVLASFSNGSPAFVEGTFGGDATTGSTGGKVLVLTGPIDADWSNLPFRRAFVPLLDRVINHMTRRQLSSASITVGQPVQFAGPGTLNNRPITVTAPDGTTKSLTAAAAQPGGAVQAAFSDTIAPGVYRVQADEGFSPNGAFAANLATRESNLLHLNEDELAAFGEYPMRVIRDRSADLAWRPGERADDGESRVELWPWLLLLAFFLFMGETMLSNIFTRRKTITAAQGTQYLGTRRNERSLMSQGGSE